MISGMKKLNLFNLKFYQAFSQAKPVTMPGKSSHVDNKSVKLRGTYIQGQYNDLPNLIFFSELIDPVNNWIPFFTNPQNQFLQYRNIWLINPRNFGNSDKSSSYDLEDQANDVVRFMYDNKISTATVGGHGFGGKLALAVGCYHSKRVTGVFGLDSGPLDYRYYEPFQEMKGYVDKAYNLNLNNKTQVEQQLKNDIECPKWRKIFHQNLVNEGGKLGWNFDMPSLQNNLQFNKSDSVGYWAMKYGLFTGRACFIFPEYSRWVHLNTNTLAMMKVCLRLKGYGHDIFAIQGDNNPMNHWMYEHEDIEFVTARKLLQFLTMYDGVHVMLKDRSEVGGKGFVPDRLFSRDDADHVYSEYSPAHVHHNWRFKDSK